MVSSSDEKAIEYKQVAALVCQDIDIYYSCAERNPEKALDFFKLLKEMKDKAIVDPAHRKMRYDAGCLIYSLPRASADKPDGDAA